MRVKWGTSNHLNRETNTVRSLFCFFQTSLPMPMMTTMDLISKLGVPRCFNTRPLLWGKVCLLRTLCSLTWFAFFIGTKVTLNPFSRRDRRIHGSIGPLHLRHPSRSLPRTFHPFRRGSRPRRRAVARQNQL